MQEDPICFTIQKHLKTLLFSPLGMLFIVREHLLILLELTVLKEVSSYFYT